MTVTRQTLWACGIATSLWCSAGIAAAETRLPPDLEDRMVCAVELDRYSSEFLPGWEADRARAAVLFEKIGTRLGFSDVHDPDYVDLQVPYADNPPFPDRFGPEALSYLEECRARYPATVASGNGTRDWRAKALIDAAAWHAANLPEGCERPQGYTPSGHELQIGEESAARQALLIGFPCQKGAYNQTEVFLMADQHGIITEVLFPSPAVEVVWPDDDQSQPPLSVTVTETRDLREVVNPDYDPASRMMRERNKWRGQNDAYSLTEWSYKDGRFQLVHFAVDASFDGQDNPETLIRNEVW